MKGQVLLWEGEHLQLVKHRRITDRGNYFPARVKVVAKRGGYRHGWYVLDLNWTVHLCCAAPASGEQGVTYGRLTPATLARLIADTQAADVAWPERLAAVKAEAEARQAASQAASQERAERAERADRERAERAARRTEARRLAADLAASPDAAVARLAALVAAELTED